MWVWCLEEVHACLVIQPNDHFITFILPLVTFPHSSVLHCAVAPSSLRHPAWHPLSNLCRPYERCKYTQCTEIESPICYHRFLPPLPPLSHPALLTFPTANTNQTWKCFFPQSSLKKVASPLFIANSIHDYTAVAILNTQQQGQDPPTQVLYCLNHLLPENGTTGGGYAPEDNPFAGKRKFKYEGSKPCPDNVTRSLGDYSSQLLRTIQTTVRTHENLRSFLLGAVAHCTTIYPSWADVTRKKVHLRDSITEWYFEKKK